MSPPVSAIRMLRSMHTPALPHRRTDRPVFASTLARPYIEEWERLASDRRVRATVRAWQLPDSVPVNGLDDLLDRLGFFGRPDDDTADAALFHVVQLAADDLLAARVVLQRVLPALVSVAKRRAGGPSRNDRETAFAETVSAAWIVIRSYPVQRRPRRVAANIVRDAEYHAFVRTRRLRSAAEQVGSSALDVEIEAGADGRAAQRGVEPMEEVLELLRDARDAGFSDDDLRLVRGLVSGRSSVQIAAELGICERSVRNRRAAITSRLRAVLLDAPVAA